MTNQLFTGEAGAGLVKVTIDTAGRARQVEIDDLIFKKTDKQLISDLFVAALNRAYEQADAWLKQQVMDNYRKNLAMLDRNKLPTDDAPVDLDITKFFKETDDGDFGKF